MPNPPSARPRRELSFGVRATFPRYQPPVNVDATATETLTVEPLLDGDDHAIRESVALTAIGVRVVAMFGRAG